MAPDQTEKKKKGVYQKPRLRTIELAAEEVLGIGCKTTGQPSPLSGPPCYAVGCNQLGS